MSKKRKMVHIHRDTATRALDNKRGGVYLSLPTPDPKVLELLEDDVNRSQYLTTVKEIAKLEAETLLKVASKRYSAIWKMLLISTIFLILILTLMISDKIKIKWQNNEFSSQKKEANR